MQEITYLPDRVITFYRGMMIGGFDLAGQIDQIETRRQPADRIGCAVRGSVMAQRTVVAMVRRLAGILTVAGHEAVRYFTKPEFCVEYPVSLGPVGSGPIED